MVRGLLHTRRVWLESHGAPPNFPTPMTIQKVLIEEGCISCSLCMDIAADVFDVPDGEDCVILSGAQTHFASKKADILLAAANCPVEVIAIEEDDKQISSGSE